MENGQTSRNIQEMVANSVVEYVQKQDKQLEIVKATFLEWQGCVLPEDWGPIVSKMIQSTKLCNTCHVVILGLAYYQCLDCFRPWCCSEKCRSPWTLHTSSGWELVCRTCQEFRKHKQMSVTMQ